MTQKPGKKYKRNNHPTGKRSAARRASIIMPEALWAKLKMISMEERTTINEVVVSAMLEKYGKATETEIRKIVPGTKKIVDLPVEAPKTPVISALKPWENCVISTHFAIEIPSESKTERANPTGQPQTLEIFKKAFKIKS